MPWTDVLGQPAALDYLRSALRAGRAPHGYLFEGPAGVGKRTAAVALAEALLCHQPPQAGEACGGCKSCRWIAARQGLLTGHPDLLPLLKDPATDKEKLLGDQEQLIPLATMQDLGSRLHKAPMNGPRRVAILPEAQRMCLGQAEAANAFLKTLEEPPARSVVILTSSRPEALLETIVSRVQPVRFRRLAANDIRAGLKASGKAQADIELAVSLADGSLGRGKEILEGGLGRWRASLVKALGAFDAQRGCPAFGLALWALADAEGKRLFQEQEEQPEPPLDVNEDDDGEASKEEEAAAKTEAGWKRFVFRRLLDLIEVAFRDGMVLASGAGEVNLLQGDESGRKLAQKLAEQFGEEGCARVLEGLREAHLATRLYVRGDLTGRALAGRMAEAAG